MPAPDPPGDDDKLDNATLPQASDETMSMGPDTGSLTASPTAVHTPTALTDIPSIVPPLAAGALRYVIGELLGRGGMGEVVLATDQQIGRDVAIKRIRSKPSPSAYARFLREATIQGRLEHPAIVPVHELSIDPDGRPFFAMKRLTGTTLHDILALRAEGDPTITDRWPRKALLRGFVDVCLAVEFAHKRGVVHRDLKPPNIMLGEYGEVYVLDWGVARVMADAGEGTAGAAGDLDTLGPATPTGNTEAGTILGTPGYIPPEQIRGDAGLDHRADVFALGCILFEILAGEPLFPRGRVGLTAPFGDYDARPSTRPLAGEVAPELDAACVAATTADPGQRIATARALGDAVQAYLDGDRDLLVRRKIAADHLAAATTALARGSGEAERRIAMREAGRALALDPTATDAADLVGRLMLEPPTAVPVEVVDEIRDLEDRELKTLTRIAVGAFMAYLMFLPAMFWIGVRDTGYVAAAAVAMCINGIMAMWLAWRRQRTSAAWIYTAIFTNGILIAIMSRMLNPFLVAPGLAAGTTMAFALYPFVRTWVLCLITGTAALGPWLLEVVGVWPRTIGTVDGDLVMHAPGLVLRMPHTEISLALYVSILVVITGVMASRLSGAIRDARQRLQLQAWHLRQLVPSNR